MSVRKVLQDISTNGYNYPKHDKFEYYYPKIKLFEFIYKQSIVGQEAYYKTCMFAAYKTSNNQDILERMPYFVFNNSSIFLNEFIDIENKGEGGDGASGAAEDMQATAKNTMNETMGSTKSMMRGMKLPKN